MKIVVSYLDVRLSMTLPKKWKLGPVRRILVEYLASPTARKLGLGPASDVEIEVDGAAVAPDTTIVAAVADGCVVRVVERRPRTPCAEGARVVSRHAFATYLTSKGEDCVSCGERKTWRGVRFGAYLVCDGHGGRSASAAAAANLVARLCTALDATANADAPPLEALVAALPGAIAHAFEATDADCSARGSGSGCTATLVLALPGAAARAAAAFAADSDDEGDGARAHAYDDGAVGATLLVCASVGDSLAYVAAGGQAGRPAPLSVDHRLDHNAEEARRCGDAAHRDWPGACLRLAPGGLMMSRALGDGDTPLALGTPQLRAALCGGAARVVLASDGLWDVVDEPQVRGGLGKGSWGGQ